MNRFIGSKCSGKTRKLIQAAHDTGAAIACSNPMAMEVKAHSYNIVGVNFINYNDVPNWKGEVMIDELEPFVQCMCYGKLAGYTLSEED